MADRGRGRGAFRGDRGSFRGGRGGFDGGSDRGGGGFRGGGGGGRGGRGGFEAVKVFGNGSFPQPNAEVEKLENASTKDVASALSGLDLQDQFPRRPGYGTVGRKIVLWTNYFNLQGVSKDTILNRYAVSFAVTGEKELPKAKKKRLIQLLLTMPPFAGVPAGSDWAQVIITAKDVNLGNSKKVFEVEWYPQDGEPLPKKADDDSEQRQNARNRNMYKLRVEKLGDVSLSELMKDLSLSASYPLKLETIQALNIILTQGPSTDRQTATVGQNRFYPFGSHPQTTSSELGGGLQALRGYFSSVRTSVNRILVNINVATGAFYKPGPLLSLLKDFTGGGPPPREERHWRQMSNFVKKLSFETNYIPDTDANGKPKKGKNGQTLTKRKVHVITEIPFNKTSQNVRFDWTGPNGQTKNVSIEEYFRFRYGVKVTSPQAPLVNCGSVDRPIFIPAEFCTVLPGQAARRLLQGDQTSQMITFAARRPFQNAESIVKDGVQVTKIHPNLNANLVQFGIKVTPELLTVQGRILAPPSLSYRAKGITPFNGAWNLDVRTLGQKPFKISRPLTSWNCLVINSGNREAVQGGPPAVTHFLGLFRQTLDTYGMNPGPVQPPIGTNINPAALMQKNVDEIKEQLTMALRTQLKAPPKFLFVLLPSDHAVLYDCVKYVCDIKLGIPSVCNIGSKFSKEKGQMQYFSNVCLKFNQKLGGVNHVIDVDKLKPLDAQTIVFGIDVTHPSPGSGETSPSIAGVVASVDVNFSQYPASIRTQKGREEMVEELEEMIIERIKSWQKRNQNRLPSKVIVYRDGVSEGQYSIVMDKEYPAFVKAFGRLYGAKPKHPKISIIVVGKRHHTRFYPTKLEDSDQKTGNPQPGTIVDRGVTGEKLFDFFLLAHQGLQGTSKPAHYVVLKDENKLGADQLQVLTHNLCYTFARACRSVSVCPPAYYADLLCERGRSYLHGVLKSDTVAFDRTTDSLRGVHQNLAETMFYI
ncbi:Piwi domain-containing protein [Lophiotrema nucula]|uniref:Piwi domain-containing protein n=1 Tax=Lophiotrema nucula TaxID=690887 RepID=A0A6A5YTX3_9PLEO|nr:Piwi domain-containing protein [Lophiotrema nucula]